MVLVNTLVLGRVHYTSAACCNTPLERIFHVVMLVPGALKSLLHNKDLRSHVATFAHADY